MTMDGADPQLQQQQQQLLQQRLKESADVRALVRLAREGITDDVLLHRIVKLDLSGLGLATLPDALPSSLANLSILFLSNNNFIEMPAIIGQCANLQMVAFKGNGMTSIHPDALQPQLRWLILTDNQLTTLPESMGRCTLLQKCMLSGNRLQQLPSDEAVQNWQRLELIRLACNQLTQVPMALLELPALKWVGLGDNPFLDSIAALPKSATLGNSSDSMDHGISLISDLPSDLLATGRILGCGAGGTTVAVEHHGQTVAVKVYQTTPPPPAVTSFSTATGSSDGVATTTTPSDGDTPPPPPLASPQPKMTSDGLPESERTIALYCASQLQCPALIRVLGVCASTQSLVMEYLNDYVAIAQPPSFDSCSRDVYPPRHSEANDEDDIDNENKGLSLALSWPEASNLVSVLLDALVQLHCRAAAGKIAICHGDFYGHNILMQQHDCMQVRLSDFGAAFFYDKDAEYGRLVQIIELRAFAVLVQEVADHLLVEGDVDDTTLSTHGKRLIDLVSQCQHPGATFDQVHIWWQQQRLTEMADAFGVSSEDNP